MVTSQKNEITIIVKLEKKLKIYIKNFEWLKKWDNFLNIF